MARQQSRKRLVSQKAAGHHPVRGWLSLPRLYRALDPCCPFPCAKPWGGAVGSSQ